MTNDAINKFKQYVCEELVNTYHMDGISAYKAVKESYLSEALQRDSDYVFHDSVEEWAEFVYNEVYPEQSNDDELAAMTTTYQDYLDFLKILNETKE